MAMPSTRSCLPTTKSFASLPKRLHDGIVTWCESLSNLKAARSNILQLQKKINSSNAGQKEIVDLRLGVCVEKDSRYSYRRARISDFELPSVGKNATMSSNENLAPWYTRRRTRSVGSAPSNWQKRHWCGTNPIYSDEVCSSSTSKDKDCSNFYQSDSDDICGGSLSRNESNNANATEKMVAAAPKAAIDTFIHTLESDSLNENSPCRRSTRRKRKYKKSETMEVDVAVNRFFHPSLSFSHTKKKRIMRIPSFLSSSFQGSRLCPSTGKRKRSLREKSRLSFDGCSSGGAGSESSSQHRDAKVLGLSKLSLNDDYPEDRPADERENYDSMEVSYAIAALSSSSVSSSGSETGIYTNDEGREGDDEQSDWVGETVSSTFNINNEDDEEEDEDEEDEDELELCYDIATNTADKSIRPPQPCSTSKIGQIFGTNSRLGLNCGANRLARRKIRSLKIGPVHHLKSGLHPDVAYRDSEIGYDTKVATSRRQTFSSYKRRKRIPSQMGIMAPDTILEKSVPLFVAVDKKLSDISSSDSKNSIL